MDDSRERPSIPTVRRIAVPVRMVARPLTGLRSSAAACHGGAHVQRCGAGGLHIRPNGWQCQMRLSGDDLRDDLVFD